MTDPERLSERGDVGARLLDAARHDAPSKGARHAAATALGIGVGSATLTTGSAAGASVKIVSGIWMKVAAAGAITLLAGGSVAFAVHEGGKPAPVVVAASQTVASAPEHAASGAGNVAQPAEEDVQAASAVPPTPPAPPTPPTAMADTRERTVMAPQRPVLTAAPRASATVAPTIEERTPVVAAPPPVVDTARPAESSLTRELRMLDVARVARERGDAAGSLRALDEYDRAFPNGSLHTEASVARIDALRAAGQKSAAKDLARRVLAADPAGPHAKRLRALIDEP